MKKIAKLICKIFLGKANKISFNAANIKRILIIRNDKIGDMIVTTPLFRELKKTYPDLVIDVVASSVNKDIVKHNPHIGEVIVWDKKGIANDIETICKIRAKRYDVIFNAMNIFSLAYLLRIKLLGAKYLIGFNIEKYQTNTKHLGMFDYTVDCVRSRHILENYFSAFENFGLKQINYNYELFGVEAHAMKTHSFLARIGYGYKGVVCFNYQGSCSERTINKDDAIRFCAELSEKYRDSAVVVIYPPHGRELARLIVNEVSRENVFLSFETENIFELASLIRECDVVISPDTAVIHLASVYNKKILGFYINTDNYKWFYPMSEKYRVLLSDKEAITALDTPAAFRALDELMLA
ncbi:MAG TPA: glycosyltransferase family 9 protein [Janthinobacterium sp.]|jgi:ADP-heptose:LPS heptosyltransferase|nr:glycosyltransferase family 9 protein [Janthinobacterium sp.]